MCILAFRTYHIVQLFVRCMWTIIPLKILAIHNWHLGFETWVLHTKVSNPGSRTWVWNPGLFPKLQNPGIKTWVSKPGFQNLGWLPGLQDLGLKTWVWKPRLITWVWKPGFENLGLKTWVDYLGWKPRYADTWVNYLGELLNEVTIQVFPTHWRIILLPLF